MERFKTGPVAEIPNTADNVYAFRVHGVMDAETSKSLSDYVNTIFDNAAGDVHFLFDLTEFEGRERPAVLDMDAMKARLRSVANIGRYAVVGAPETAETMIEAMDKVVPVDARTFASDEREKAWAFVGAQPLAS